MLARHEEDPVSARRSERSQGVRDVPVGSQHAVESGERVGLRAPERRIFVRATRIRGPGQVERVAVQDEVGRASGLRVEGVEKQGELVRPAEVLIGPPLPGLVAAEAQVQVGDDGDEPPSGVRVGFLGGDARRDGRPAAAEARGDHHRRAGRRHRGEDGDRGSGRCQDWTHTVAGRMRTRPASVRAGSPNRGALGAGASRERRLRAGRDGHATARRARSGRFLHRCARRRGGWRTPGATS